MLADAAVSVGHPVVAAVLGLGAAGLAGAVVAMAWNVHVAELRMAELLAHRQFSAPAQNGTQARASNGHSVPRTAAKVPTPRRQAGEASSETGRAARAGPVVPLVIEGPDTVVTGERARYRILHSDAQQVVSWTAGGGSVSQSADPDHPDELILVAAQPGDLTVAVRVREGLVERREMKSVTAVPDPHAVVPRFVPGLFLQEWGLTAVAVLMIGFAGALVALGSLAASDFIALVAPLGALLAVIAATRGSGTPQVISGKNSHPETRGKGP